MKKILVTALFAALSSTAFAADLYVGAGVNQLDLSVDGEPNVKPSALNLTLGAQLNPNLAVEARLYTNLADDQMRVSNTSVDVDVSLDHAEGVYLKGILPFNEQVAAYALAGYTNAAMKASVGNFSVTSDDESDFSYGLGVTYQVNKRLGLNLEYARLLSGSDYKLNNLGASLTYRF